ncbi:MAG: sulfatase [Deltaproteobacteria bacterium]|nr:sulfatase [Deltaproteobacteria bacterium]
MPSKRLWRLSLLAGGLIAAAVMATYGRRAPVRSSLVNKPNVLLITIDTLRADHVSAYGYMRPTTPHLDRLASEGVMFENCYSAANVTNPSHISLLTGTRVSTHGVTSNTAGLTAPHITTLAERFRKAGYATAAVVSIGHLGQENSGLGRGFDDYYDVKDERRATDSVLVTRQWLGAHAERPFFVWLHLWDPHMRYNPPPPYDRRYVRASSPRIDLFLKRSPLQQFFRANRVPPSARDRLRELFKLGFKEAVGNNQIGLTREEIDYLVALYDGEIAYVDATLAGLFGDLHELGLSDDTLLVVTADHGEAFGEHSIYCDHRTIYNETLHVPLIMRYPRRIPAGRRVANLVSGIDLAPTVLQYAGLRLDGPLEGRSLLPAIEQGPAQEPVPLFAEHAKGIASMVRDGQWKLIIGNRAAKPRLHPNAFELFNLDDDPHERRDLTETKPEMIAKLQQVRQAWLTAPAVAPEANERPVDAETLERMRALGYVD